MSGQPVISRVAGLVAGVVLSVAAIELLLHAIEASPAWRVLPVVEREPGWPDPATGYTLRPDQAIVNVREQRARVTTNAAGMRDRARVPEKPEGGWRVAVTGDSFTEALQVADDATFTRLAETRLNRDAATPAVEVLNFGMSGAGPVQQLVRAQHSAAPFAPDALVMMINAAQFSGAAMTDDTLHPAYVRQADGRYALGYAFRERRSQRYRDTLVGHFFFSLMDHSRLARAVYLAVVQRNAGGRANAGSSDALVPCAHVGSRIAQLAAPWSAASNDRRAAVLETWLSDTARFSGASDTPIALVLFGLGQPRADCRAATRDRQDYLGRVRARVSRFGFRVWDGDADAARIAAGSGITSPLTGFGRTLGSGHLNETGHEVYARLLEQIVRELMESPGRSPPDF